MELAGTHVIDPRGVGLKAYRLLCAFFADKEISRRTMPNDPTDGLRRMQRLYFESEVSGLLIEIAAAVRVLDDQMRLLPAGDFRRTDFERRMRATDGYVFGLFDFDIDDPSVSPHTLRQVCNRIIHTSVFQPHSTDGQETHERDTPAIAGVAPPSIEWRHLNGYVRLAGNHQGKVWILLLDIEAFVRAVYTLLLGDGPPVLAGSNSSQQSAGPAIGTTG